MVPVFKKLKVVELASILAGPAVGTFFAEMGAEVIKVENKKTGGDITRSWKTPGENPDKNISAYYASANWGKKIIFTDLTIKEEIAAVHELIRKADILIVNFKAGADQQFEMDYKTILKLNPSIIYAAISGYGENNPKPAFDALLQAETGYMSMNGSIESGPVKMPVAMIDILAAHQLKEGILSALLNRQLTNEGAYVSISLFDTAIASLANQASNWLMAGHLPGRMGSLHPNIAPYGDLFITKNGKQIMLAVGTDAQFFALVQVLGSPGLAKDTKLSSNALRVENREYLQKSLQPLFANELSGELLKKLHNNNIPAGDIRNLEEVFSDPEAKRLILEEQLEGVLTKRVKTAVFKTRINHN